MKLKINHFDVNVFRKKLDNLKHIDFSLFIDSFPENQEELSSINILVLQEPNEYFGIHDLAIKHQDTFSFILQKFSILDIEYSKCFFISIK